MLKLLKGKKLLWGLGAIIALLVVVYGAMKYDNYRIRSLEQSILEAQIERESATRQTQRIQNAVMIDEEVLSRLLDTQTELRSQSERTQKQLEVYLDELNKGIHDDSIPEMETASETERVTLINRAFSQRIIDSMYDTYCSSVRDNTSCPE